MYTLYYSPGACSLATHIVIEETGATYELAMISTKDQTQTPAWKAVNPKGRVPALSPVAGRIGGTDNLLTEASAIMFYLARTHPEAQLLPPEIAAQARCIEWMSWLTSTVHAQSFGQLWRTPRFTDDESQFPAIRAKGLTNVRDAFGYIERLLGDGRDWAVPGGYSIVDAYLTVFFVWGKRLEIDMRRDYPAWTQQADKVAVRPAVQRVLAQEGLAVF